MNQDVRRMLERMYSLLSSKFHDPVKAWDSLIEVLAVDNCGGLIFQLDHKFEWLFEDVSFARRLIKTYDSELLRSDYYDHLGEMYLEKVVDKKKAQGKGLYLMPMPDTETAAVVNVIETDKTRTILDPAVATGRLLMAVHKMTPNSKLFGVDVDLRALRIAFTNFAIHSISGYLLHADSLKHEIDINNEDGISNWHYANRWYSCMDKLKEARSKGFASQIQKGQKALLREVS